MADAAYFTLATALTTWHKTGTTMRTGNKHAGLSIAPYDVYRCTDGHVALIAVTDRHWRSVLKVIGREDLVGDPRFTTNPDRAKYMTEIDGLVEGWTSTRPRREVASALQAAHVPAAAVRIVDEVVRDEAAHARKSLQWIEHPDLGTVPLPHSPIRWHDSELLELEPSPQLGEHTRLVFAELLGFSEDQLETLADVITARPPAV